MAMAEGTLHHAHGLSICHPLGKEGARYTLQAQSLSYSVG